MAPRGEVDTVFEMPCGLAPINSAQDDNEQAKAKEKARQLLKNVLPENLWREFEEKEIIQLKGKRGYYVISDIKTEICDLKTGKCVAFACLQLSIPKAPTFDRMVAEYLFIKNNEDEYWKTANIFPQTGNTLLTIILLLILSNIGLFMNLLLEIFTIR